MVIENMDMADEDKEKFKEYQEIEKAVAMTTSVNAISQNMAQISGAKLAREQSELMLANLGVQPSQQQPKEQITPPNQQIQQVPQQPQPEPQQQIQSPDTEEIGV